MTSDLKRTICLPIDCEGSLAFLLIFNVMQDAFYSFYFFCKVQDRKGCLNNYFYYCSVNTDIRK